MILRRIRLSRRALRLLRRLTAEVDADTLANLAERGPELRAKSRGALATLREDVELLYHLVGDYARRRYRALPWKTVAAAAGALLYVLMPLDAIPDAIPVVGLADDAAIVLFILRAIHDDLHAYKAWRAAPATAQPAIGIAMDEG
jgi:uncharacterized membrane protein YkvA (DUF1232 family)